MSIFSDLAVALKKRSIKRHYEQVIRTYEVTFALAIKMFKVSERFSNGIPSWNLDNPLLQEWLGYNFGLADTAAASLIDNPFEQELTRDLVFSAMIEKQFGHLPNVVDIYLEMESDRLMRRLAGEDNSGMAADLQYKKPFYLAYALAVEDLNSESSKNSLRGLLTVLAGSYPDNVFLPDDLNKNEELRHFRTTQEFSTDQEAREFANWINGTTPDASILITKSDSKNCWTVEWTETRHLEDDPSGYIK